VHQRPPQGEVLRPRADSAPRTDAPTDDALFEDLREIYELLNANERRLLRHRSWSYPTLLH
jgi:hypothetical protein